MIGGNLTDEGKMEMRTLIRQMRTETEERKTTGGTSGFHFSSCLLLSTYCISTLPIKHVFYDSSQTFLMKCLLTVCALSPGFFPLCISADYISENWTWNEYGEGSMVPLHPALHGLRCTSHHSVGIRCLELNLSFGWLLVLITGSVSPLNMCLFPLGCTHSISSISTFFIMSFRSFVPVKIKCESAPNEEEKSCHCHPLHGHMKGNDLKHFCLISLRNVKGKKSTAVRRACSLDMELCGFRGWASHTWMELNNKATKHSFKTQRFDF